MTQEEELAIADHYKAYGDLLKDLCDTAVKDYAINESYIKEELLAYRSGVYTMHNLYKQAFHKIDNLKKVDESQKGA